MSFVRLTVSKVAAERRQKVGGSRHEPTHKASHGFPLSHNQKEKSLFFYINISISTFVSIHRVSTVFFMSGIESVNKSVTKLPF